MHLLVFLLCYNMCIIHSFAMYVNIVYSVLKRHSTILFRLNSDLQKMEKKKIVRPPQQSQSYLDRLSKERDQARKVIIQKLKAVVSERRWLISLIPKYAS